MTITVRNIIPAKQAEAAQTTQYTAPAKCVIDSFYATNTTGTAATISVNLVPSGGSAADGNIAISARTIQPGETRPLYELYGQALETGGFISTLAGTASAITIRATGREIT